ncbi:hypothetical protein [Endothiovibrio diazotrophicus]
MHKFVICIKNTGYEVSLEQRKLYEVLPDDEAAKHGQLRVADESGEDYLYPMQLFMELGLSDEIAENVSKIA